jgi:hypothetical protein
MINKWTAWIEVFKQKEIVDYKYWSVKSPGS